MNKGYTMKTDLYKLVQTAREDILVEVEALNTHFYVKVNKGDFLNQIAERGLTLDEMEASLMFGPGNGLYVAKRYK